jgi:hypothetical protein
MYAYETDLRHHLDRWTVQVTVSWWLRTLGPNATMIYS